MPPGPVTPLLMPLGLYLSIISQQKTDKLLIETLKQNQTLKISTSIRNSPDGYPFVNQPPLFAFVPNKGFHYQ